MSDTPAIHGRLHIDLASIWETFRAGGEWRQWVPFLIALVGLPGLLAVNHGKTHGIMPAAIMFTLTAAIGALSLAFILWRRTRNLNVAERDIEVTFDALGMMLRDGTGAELRTPWTAIRLVRECLHGLIVRGTSSERYISFRGFSPGDLPRLRALLAQHVSFKPR